VHVNSKLIFTNFAKEYFKKELKVLEIGPNNHPSAFLKEVGHDSSLWDTLDVFEDKRLTYPNADPFNFPVDSEKYDLVFSAQVIEHVRKPWAWVKELARVTKPGGKVITINPISWPYHEAPIDCWRIYPEGMKALYEDAGLKVEMCEMKTLEEIRSKNALPGHGAVDPSDTKLKPGTKKKYFEIEETPSLKSKLIKLFGWPVTYSIDCVTVGIK
jgi:ubiquinone/menaquinone biosynthesis C-methylase UbiE